MGIQRRKQNPTVKLGRKKKFKQKVNLVLVKAAFAGNRFISEWQKELSGKKLTMPDKRRELERLSNWAERNLNDDKSNDTNRG